MQFKHPEILYFLFLLVIPIIVHLFQLRRFKKEYFTNVKLLKQLQIQTQKSSTIKKWLLLATRLLLLAALIFAFAQPFFKGKDDDKKNNELVILLDNSFSMQAKGNKGELLKRAVQELIEETPETKNLSLLTSNDVFWDTDIKSIQKELLNLKYSGTPFEIDNLITKVQAKKPNTSIDYVIISDAINVESKKTTSLSEGNSLYFMDAIAQNKNNVSIENVTLSQNLDQFYEIKVTLKSFGEQENGIPLSIVNGAKNVAKTIVNFKEKEQTVIFTLPKTDFHGYAQIQDKGLNYDNTFYFSIEKPKKIKVTAIGTADKNAFLNKIYIKDEFDVTNYTISEINYSELENQHTIVLNELEEIPSSLATNLNDFYAKGGNVIIIPSATISLDKLNSLTNKVGNTNFTANQNQEKKITKISFSHPLYQNVFEKKITNFQYPEVKQSFALSSKGLPILQFEDGSSFLQSSSNQVGSIYTFSAPINKQNSNFQNSPLIVPTFYNMAQTKGNSGKLSHIIGENEVVLIDAITSKDEVISIQNEDESFIPMQQILNTKIKLSLGDLPENSGNFAVEKKEQNLKNISFNYSRTESDLESKNENTFDNFTKVNDISTVFNEIESSRSSKEFWKWFTILALLFLVSEMLIQKFVK
ncbi:BatA and WFA domain-containing protein [Flavobacterium gelidilacus]|uniref:vWA domain-containing protein n=1 Tax=Flavobacterium gelidilacus TaxID=206041 RepID=UPI00041E37FC|nr:BatA and WFA domain-containing protein [Flavobacterium gelidilacus]